MIVGLIDYGAGNLSSVRNAIISLGYDTKIVSNADDFVGIDKLIFPGVGSFGDTMSEVDSRELRDPLCEWIKTENPFFGICIGYQFLFESSEESSTSRGLGIFSGKVEKFKETLLKVPHMGWNRVSSLSEKDKIWTNIEEGEHFYFVHSFYPAPEDPSLVSSVTEYGVEFGSSVRRKNLFATQFHPEKSQSAGLTLLDNFIKYID